MLLLLTVEPRMTISNVINELISRTAEAWNPPSWWNLLITLPWVIGLVFLLSSSVSDRAIAGREQTTSGVIRAHEPANHNRFGYDFSVNGKLYTGWQIPLREFQIGQRVLVYYDPLDPTKSSLDGFEGATDRVLGPALFCAVGITAVVVLIFVRRRAHAQRSRRNDTQ
jgi:hypothetical protein